MKKSSDSFPSSLRYLHLKNCSSTQDSIKNVTPEWFLLRADRQKSGRGQKDRTWRSPEGGLYYSVKFPDPSTDQGHTPRYLLRAARQWVRLLQERFPDHREHFRLKWPNDLLYKNSKLGGFIGEKSGDNVFVGIGINGNNQFVDADETDFRLPPVSLRTITGESQNMGKLLMDWYRRFRSVIGEEAAGDPPDFSAIENCMRTIGRTVRYRDRVGDVVGLAPNGGLEILLEGERHIAHRTDDVEVLES